MPDKGELWDTLPSGRLATSDVELVRKTAAPQLQARTMGLAELAAIRATACQPHIGRQSGQIESRKGARERGLADIAHCSVLFYAGLRRSKTDQDAEGSVCYLPREAMRVLGVVRPADPAVAASQ